MKKKYRIYRSIDPHHSPGYRRGWEILGYDGYTPVKYLVSIHSSEDEAKSALWDLARERLLDSDFYWYECDWSIDDRRKELEEAGEKFDAEWYKGPGIYETIGESWRILVMEEGDSSFEDDLWRFGIEEMEDDE